MSLFGKHFQQVKKLPPKLLINEIALLVKRRCYIFFHKTRDRKHCTFSDSKSIVWSKLSQMLEPPPVEKLKPYGDRIAGVTDLYLQHRFNLLGSGWVKVHHGMLCGGLEGIHFKPLKGVKADTNGNWLAGRINPANLITAQSVWSMIDKTYTPIDWQIDFKSGFRWSERTWYKDIVFGLKRADIKVPWELSRMQHLTLLVWAYSLAADGHMLFSRPDTYSREFRNQVLDFIATNPPRYGANWYFAMDVAIRVANWLICYDLFKGLGVSFEADFESVFKCSVFDHGLHIANNLEHRISSRNNHYIADIIGLLFVSVYLENVSKIDKWLVFAVRELIKEVYQQFYPDGSNFEASTAYHRLTAEMVLYGTSLILALPECKIKVLRKSDIEFYKVVRRNSHALGSMNHYTEKLDMTPFPDWYFERLEKMAEFTMHITKPNGDIPQIGDNDNGRFLKLNPAYKKRNVAEAKSVYLNLTGYNELPNEAIFWDENHLDHRHIVSGIQALFDRDDFRKFSQDQELEPIFINNMIGSLHIASYRKNDAKQSTAELIRVGNEEILESMENRLNCLPQRSRKIVKIPYASKKALEHLQLFAYPNFGLYLFRSPNIYLAIRCGSYGLNSTGSHAHNDQLAVELTLNGKNWICDPGTYLYTPLPERRNEYRSVNAHFCPQLPEQEPSDLNAGLFNLSDQSQAICFYFGESGFGGMHTAYGAPVYRIVKLADDFLIIKDYAETETPLKDIYRLDPKRIAQIPYSPAYGARYA